MSDERVQGMPTKLLLEEQRQMEFRSFWQVARDSLYQIRDDIRRMAVKMEATMDEIKDLQRLQTSIAEMRVEINNNKEQMAAHAVATRWVIGLVIGVLFAMLTLAGTVASMWVKR
jgi:hypothetical protein